MKVTKYLNNQSQSAINPDANKQGISTAFRKLLRRVTTQKGAFSQKKNISRNSFSSFHNELLLKKKKNSTSLFQDKKRPYLFSKSLKGNQPCNATEPIQRRNESGLNRKFNQSPFRSVRCHSNPSSVKNSRGDIRRKDIHELLQARTFQFQLGKSTKSVNRALTDIFFPKKSSNQPKNDDSIKSKVKYGQKRRQFNNIVKGRQVSAKTKTEKVPNKSAWEPWESEKIDQLYFASH